MKLIVGLGNPGKEYENTRHNSGFKFIDKFAKANNLEITKEKFKGLYTTFNYKNEKIILLKPQKYMNLSGEVIKSYVDFFKINIEDILIICDDLDTPLGKLKLKYKGSSGGHNGLKNIELNLSTNEYKRIKIGIAYQKYTDQIDYVIGKIPKEELDILEKVTDQAPQIINDYLNMNFDNLMNKYNTEVIK
jgi:PTH1 family peptidyl-tRNA hydrolase